MATLPKGEGVLAPGAQGAYKVILFVVGWFLAGVAATVAVVSMMGSPARASTQSEHSVDLKLEAVLSDLAAVKRDIAIIRCRLNIDGVCPH